MTIGDPTMHALMLDEPGGPETLRWRPAPRPAPGTGDVLVEVHAASYTPGELDWPSTWVDRSGHDRRPIVPCHEFSGVVVEVGWGVAGVTPGDEVYGLADWYRDGAAGEFIAVEARNVARRPHGVTHQEAAVIPLAGLTAWQGLFRHGGLRPDRTVAIHGAAGGVGTFAVQLAAAAGARVIATGRDRDEALAVELGADLFIPTDRLDELPAGIDLVFDTIGGSVLSGTWPRLPPTSTVVSVAEVPSADEAAAHGVRAVYFVVEPDRDGLAMLADHVEGGRLRPIVGATCVASSAGAMLAEKDRGGIRGKVVIDLETSMAR